MRSKSKKICKDDYGYLAEIATLSDVYEEINIGKKTKIELCMVGSNGIFIVLDKPANYEGAIKEIRDCLNYYGTGIFFILNMEDGAYLVERGDRTLLPMEDLFSSFKNIYRNTMDAFCVNQVRLSTYKGMLFEPRDSYEAIEKDSDDGDEISTITLVTESNVERINSKLAEIKDGMVKKNIKTDEDGTVYVAKYSSNRLTGLVSEKKWFRCSDEDPDTMMKLTFFGGWFGLHKFKERNIWGGLLYFFTCGFFGIFYFSDLLELALGNRFYTEITYTEQGKTLTRTKEKIYYQPLRNKKLAAIFCGLSIVMSFILLYTLYKALYNGLLELIKMIFDNYAETQTNGLNK